MPIYSTDLVDEATQALRACSPLRHQNGSMLNIPGSTTMVDSSLHITPFYLPEPMTITGLGWIQVVNGNYTADNNNRLGIYTSDGTNLDLVASCADDANLWQPGSAGGKQKALSTPYAAAAGWYYFAHLYNNSAQVTAPTIARHNTVSAALQGVWGNDSWVGGTLAAQTDLPAETAIAGFTALTQPIWWGVY